MTLKQTTQQFLPFILGLDLATVDQQLAVEQQAVTLSRCNRDQGPSGTIGVSRKNSRHTEPQPRHAEPQPRHAVPIKSGSASPDLRKTITSIGNIIWLNQIDQPFGIEQWRDLLPQIQSTINNQTLVVAILRADSLSLATQNAMLKSLEEPPPNVQFLLVTNRPTALLATIQSRCHLLQFEQEKQSTSQVETITLLNSVVNGSISDALIASDQFKDRDQAKDWIIQALDWSQKQMSQLDQQEHIANQQSSDLEATNDLDYPTWITALLTAHNQLEQNLHVKLVMDQLFLTLVDKKTSSC